MAASTNVSYTYIPVAAGLQPFSSPGQVQRSGFVTTVASQATISFSDSVTAISGLLSADAIGLGSVIANAWSLVNTANSDGTIALIGGAVILRRSGTEAFDALVTTISRS